MKPEYLALTARNVVIPKAFAGRSDALRWADENADTFPEHPGSGGQREVRPTHNKAGRLSGTLPDPLAIRLFRNSAPDPGGCWRWTGNLSNGYGIIQYQGRTKRAHRLAYTLWVGPIPDGMFVCHRCDVPACINPRHLFVATPLENMADMVAKGRQRSPYRERSECSAGHPYTEATTRIDRQGRRRCRICARARQAAWQAKKRTSEQ